MDIVAIIEKYIELSIRRDNVKQAIEQAKMNYHYSKVEGDMAFHDGDYELEGSYNTSARRWVEEQELSEKDLSQVEHLVDITHNTYEDILQTLDESQLKQAIDILAIKMSDAKQKLEDLSRRRKWASKKGDEEFAKGNYEKEEVYNSISSDCLRETERIKPTVYYYDLFIGNLEYYMNKFLGPSGPGR